MSFVALLPPPAVELHTASKSPLELSFAANALAVARSML